MTSVDLTEFYGAEISEIRQADKRKGAITKEIEDLGIYSRDPNTGFEGLKTRIVPAEVIGEMLAKFIRHDEVANLYGESLEVSVNLDQFGRLTYGQLNDLLVSLELQESSHNAADVFASEIKDSSESADSAKKSVCRLEVKLIVDPQDRAKYSKIIIKLEGSASEA